MSQAKIRQSYKDLFTGGHGHDVLDDLIKQGHILEPVVSPEQEGERRIVLYILSMVNWKPIDLRNKLEEMTKNG